jgi:hypothetical protein
VKIEESLMIQATRVLNVEVIKIEDLGQTAEKMRLQAVQVNKTGHRY